MRMVTTSLTLRVGATGSHRRHLSLAALDFQQERRPSFERSFALRKIIMRVVYALDAGQLVVEATLRDLAAMPNEDKCVRMVRRKS